MADAAVIGPAVEVLTRPADPLLASATDKLQALATSFGRGKIGQPYKYWFWNLTSTRALKTLVESGAVTPRGNGQYRFDGLNRKPVK